MSFNSYAGIAGGAAGIAVFCTLGEYPIVAGIATTVSVSSSLCAIKEAIKEITARAKPQTPEASLSSRNDTSPKSHPR